MVTIGRHRSRSRVTNHEDAIRPTCSCLAHVMTEYRSVVGRTCSSQGSYSTPDVRIGTDQVASHRTIDLALFVNRSCQVNGVEAAGQSAPKRATFPRRSVLDSHRMLEVTRPRPGQIRSGEVIARRPTELARHSACVRIRNTKGIRWSAGVMDFRQTRRSAASMPLGGSDAAWKSSPSKRSATDKLPVRTRGFMRLDYRVLERRDRESRKRRGHKSWRLHRRNSRREQPERTGRSWQHRRIGGAAIVSCLAYAVLVALVIVEAKQCVHRMARGKHASTPVVLGSTTGRIAMNSSNSHAEPMLPMHFLGQPCEAGSFRPRFLYRGGPLPTIEPRVAELGGEKPISINPTSHRVSGRVSNFWLEARKRFQEQRDLDPGRSRPR